MSALKSWFKDLERVKGRKRQRVRMYRSEVIEARIEQVRRKQRSQDRQRHQRRQPWGDRET